MRTRTTTFLALFVVAVLAFGAQAGAATSPSSDPRPVTVKQAGFRISVPPDWTVFDPTNQESREQFAAAAAVVPELEAYSGAAAQGAQHGVLTALKVAPDERLSFGVQHYAETRAVEPVSLLRNQMRDSGILRQVRVARVRVIGRPAVLAQADLPIPNAVIHISMYEVVGRRGLLIFVFASTDPVVDTARTTMATLELLR